MPVSMLTVITLLGWVGAAAGLLAYGMVSKGRWTAGSVAFQITNVAAAGLMLSVAAVNGVWPSVAGNAAWVVIGGQALVTIARGQAKARRTVPSDVSHASDVDLAA